MIHYHFFIKTNIPMQKQKSQGHDNQSDPETGKLVFFNQNNWPLTLHELLTEL